MGWLLFILVVVVGYVAGVGFTLAARRFEVGTAEDDPLAGVKLTGIYTLFAVILGFVVFSSWQFYLEASDSVRQEAAAIAVVNRSARSLPANLGEPVANALADYVIEASGQDWTDLRHHIPTSDGHVALEQLNRAITNLPAGQSASISNAQNTMMYYLGQIESSRADRVFFSEDADPEFVWALLAIGGLVTIGLSATLHFRSKWVHAQMVGAVSAVIAASLFTVYALNHPYTGPFPVTAQPLTLALQVIKS